MTRGSEQGTNQELTATPSSERVAWVDYAKGWSILLVVTMHSALGVGLALDKAGWLHPLVAFAKPFRMPDFFLVAGLFLGKSIDWPWRAYLDRKVIHFIYFFMLWTFLILLAKSGELGLTGPMAFLPVFVGALFDPFSSLWFVQLLPLLFLVLRLARNLHPAAVLLPAATLHVAAAMFPDGGQYAMGSDITGWMTVDTFALFFVYFAVGHYARIGIFSFAERVAHCPLWALGGLCVWAALQQWAVILGLTEVPGLTLVFGLIGGGAVVTAASLMASKNIGRAIAFCGRKSLPIYLSFAIPMAAARIVLIRTGFVSDPGTLSAIVAAIAIIAPLVLEAVVRNTWASFLFTRPAWAHLRNDRDDASQKLEEPGSDIRSGYLQPKGDSMKYLNHCRLGAALAIGLASFAIALPVTGAPVDRILVAQADKPSGEGKVNSVDAAGRKVNMTHGPVTALKWPGMTMDFGVAPGVDMGAFKPGAKVGFTLKQGAGGMYEIDSVKPTQ